MVFQYIPRMDIVCVKGEPHSRFLRAVLEGDTGEDSPNPANEYQIDAFDKCVAFYHGECSWRPFGVHPYHPLTSDMRGGCKP
jgi:hypothetical protein